MDAARKKQEFMSYAKRRIVKKNSKNDKECLAYFKETSLNNKRKWNTGAGGFRF